MTHKYPSENIFLGILKWTIKGVEREKVRDRWHLESYAGCHIYKPKQKDKNL